MHINARGKPMLPALSSDKLAGKPSSVNNRRARKDVAPANIFRPRGADDWQPLGAVLVQLIGLLADNYASGLGRAENSRGNDRGAG
jgi:hypothetical protein